MEELIIQIIKEHPIVTTLALGWIVSEITSPHITITHKFEDKGDKNNDI